MVCGFDLPPMFVAPISFPGNLNVLDGGFVYLYPFTVNRNGEPFGSMSRFYPISISPTPSIILDIIQEYENVCTDYLVKITPPWNI